MNEIQREVLRAIADTVVPRVERADDPHGFWARSGSELGADEAVAEAIAQMPELQREGLGQLADGLARMGFLAASQRSREQLLRNLAALGPEAAAGAQALVGLSLFFAYSIPDPATGVNPLWAEFGYPGPGAPPRAAAQGRGRRSSPRATRPLYEADAVVVGSGAGGGVIAAALAEAGQRVIVLEAGGLFDEADFNGYELWAYQNLYWRGGPNPTADMNVSLYAGAGLRRRHHDQLDQLPAHQALGARAVGARARARGPRRARVRPPPRRGLGAPLGQRPLLAT